MIELILFWVVLEAPVVTTLHTNRLPAAPATARFAYLSTFQARSLGWAGFAGWGRPIVAAPPALAGEPARSSDLLMLDHAQGKRH